MSKECEHNCQDCSRECDERDKSQFMEKSNALSKIKKVIGVVSGKGGVGKSIVTSMLAVLMKRNSYKTAILDADVTGPSIPKAFGLSGKADGSDIGIYPVVSKTGIKIISSNLLLENDTDPIIWRGPLIANMVKQFWTDVIWDDIDFMFIDMPPGTGDVPLTVFQSLPVDAIIIVASPQELVSMIVAKAVNMASQMNIPILGLVENMSYVKCPKCGEEIRVFGESRIEETAKSFNLDVLAKLPIDPKLAAACDKGMIELFDGTWLDNTADKLIELLNNSKNKTEVIKMKIAAACEGKLVTEHFGHCENFMIFDAENNKIVNSQSIPNPGHKPGYLPNFLNDLGVNVIISGGMGGGAIDIFNEKNIEVITGASGDAKTAAEAYLNDKLISSGSVCHEHQHKDECGK